LQAIGSEATQSGRQVGVEKETGLIAHLGRSDGGGAVHLEGELTRGGRGKEAAAEDAAAEEGLFFSLFRLSSLLRFWSVGDFDMLTVRNEEC
jgi:hypothetical protein